MSEIVFIAAAYTHREEEGIEQCKEIRLELTQAGIPSFCPVLECHEAYLAGDLTRDDCMRIALAQLEVSKSYLLADIIDCIPGDVAYRSEGVFDELCYIEGTRMPCYYGLHNYRNQNPFKVDEAISYAERLREEDAYENKVDAVYDEVREHGPS